VLVLLTLFVSALLSHLSEARAGETIFGYLYTTDLQPKGKLELEQWFTDREGQAHGFFHHLDMSTEVEYGVTDNFQVALYLNYMYADESGNSVRHKTEGIEIPYEHNPDQRYQAARFDGGSFELMYRALSPYSDPVGLAFYVEPEFGFFESGVEFRGIVQKNLLDDTLILALNFWAEFEREQGSNLVAPGSDEGPDGSYSRATYAEADLGVSYRFARGWYGGLEFRNHNEYRGYTLAHSNQDHTAFFLGPNIHYAAQRWYTTFAILRQLGAVAYTADQKAEITSGRLYGDEHTTWDGIRLIVGFPFE
jgi:hypothetical protein